MNTRNDSETPTDFRSAGVNAALVQALQKQNKTVPTHIQHQTIPVALQGKDIIGIAQTGTGKTLAFGIPLLQRLSEEGGRALVVVPTRELAYQVEESLKHFAHALKMQTVVFVGGVSFGLQRKMLRKNPRILIATPGRLNDHLERKTITLAEVKVLVLDEADRMLDMGFKPQINKILEHVPKERQTLLFSATMPQAIFTLAKKEMQFPLRIEVAPAGTAAKNVEQELIIVRQENKGALLLSLLEEMKGSILIFSRTKHGAKKITKYLNASGHKAAEIHGNRSLPQRREALEGFKKGKYRLLVATDIAARGIDVKNISIVINYDLPDDPSDYVHRIGRTGRAGSSGFAVSFASPNQARCVRDIEKLIRAPIQRTSSSSVPEEKLEGKKGSGKKSNSRSRKKPSRRSSTQKKPSRGLPPRKKRRLQRRRSK